SASAATTPAQTPRTSIQETRSSQAKLMTHQEALESAMLQSVQLVPALNNIM
ncbi:hypothetical protein BGZ49_003371, partial [Haplosporangium sp. Z 27]